MRKEDLLHKIQSHEAGIGVIGLGYVGLPLVLRFGEEGFNVIGFDVDPAKVSQLNAGQSYIRHIEAGWIHHLRSEKRLGSDIGLQAALGARLHHYLCSDAADPEERSRSSIHREYGPGDLKDAPGRPVDFSRKHNLPRNNHEILLDLFKASGLRSRPGLFSGVFA